MYKLQPYVTHFFTLYQDYRETYKYQKIMILIQSYTNPSEDTTYIYQDSGQYINVRNNWQRALLFVEDSRAILIFKITQ